MFSFVRNCHSAFHSICTIFHYYQQWMRILAALHLHQQLLLPLLLNFNYFNRYMVVSCCFNLNFPNDRWCRSSFHMYICYLYICQGVQIFCPYFNWVVFSYHFLTIGFEGFCIFWVQILCQIRVLQIFPQIHDFIFLSVFWRTDIFNINKVLFTDFFSFIDRVLLLYLKTQH